VATPTAPARAPAARRAGHPTGASTPEAAECDPIGERTFDDLYALGDDRVLGIETIDLLLRVRYETGYPLAQVYAPPGAGFVCLEPMTAPTNALVDGTCPVVDPGGSFTAAFAIEVAQHRGRPGH
jgi:aldose 1-epimerase